MKEASFYQKQEGGKVKCELCNHFCFIEDGKRGACGVRENREGELFSLNYGRLVSQNIDPIEKKPLNHFLPGTPVLSFGTAGCNLTCKFCQNWEIAQARPDDTYNYRLSPDQVISSISFH